MKRKEKTNRSQKITLRLRPEEYQQVIEKFKRTTCRKLSEYLRNILLGKVMHVKHRNQSADEFLTIALQLKKELTAIGETYSQAVEKMQPLSAKPQYKEWISIQEDARVKLANKYAEILLRMDQIYQQWLQK